jgi:WD40 repeat protein
VAWSRDGRRVVSGSWDKTAKVWDVSGEAAALVHTLEGHSEEVTSVAWSRDGRRVVSGSGDKTAKVWDVSGEAAALLQTLEGHSTAVQSVAWSPDGNHVVSASSTMLCWHSCSAKSASYELRAMLPAWDGGFTLTVRAATTAGSHFAIAVGTGHGHVFTVHPKQGKSAA